MLKSGLFAHVEFSKRLEYLDYLLLPQNHPYGILKAQLKGAVMNSSDLVKLVQRVFQPGDNDTGLAIIVDLPDTKLPDNPEWQARREMATNWAALLNEAKDELDLEAVTLAWYHNAGGNNADLPELCIPLPADKVLNSVEELEGCNAISFNTLFTDHSMILAPTELSATAPLKVAVRDFEMRAATMPGFLSCMIPALQIDYTEVNRRVEILKTLVNDAESATVIFEVGDKTHKLNLDLRFNPAHASGGLFPTNGSAGNLPSGETYVVPYEGNLEAKSLTAGEMPVQFEDEVVLYKIEENKAVAVLSEGPHSKSEAEYIKNEPAYANLSELGLGVLGDFGLQPTGTVLLDEKLGVHIAFGRSDHFGGSVSPADFSSDEAVVHIDRVYIPEMQSRIVLSSLTFHNADGDREIMNNFAWTGVF